MAYQNTCGLWLPHIFPIGNLQQTVLVFDATGEKVAMSGRVWWPEDGTTSKDIQKVAFRFGNVTKAGGSALTVSLQDPTNPSWPLQPDGTQDQTISIANNHANFTSGGWFPLTAFSANRTVNKGDLLSLVWEFDGSGRLGSDSVAIAAWYQNMIMNMPAGANYAGSAWTEDYDYWAIHVLQFTDSTYGVIGSTTCGPAKGLGDGTSSFTSSSNPNEYALKFQVPFKCKIDQLWVDTACTSATGATDLILYQGTTLIEAVRIPMPGAASLRRVLMPLTTARELTPNTAYYIALKPTNATSTTYAYYDTYDSNAIMAVAPGGINFTYATRFGAGAWSETTTRRMRAGFHICALDDGAGGGGLSRARLQRGF